MTESDTWRKSYFADFALGLAFPLTYEQQYGVQPNANENTDGDGDQDFDDIPGFVELLGGELSTTATERTTASFRGVGIVSVHTATDTVNTMPPATKPAESKPPDLDKRRYSRRAIKQLDEPGGGRSREGDLRGIDETVWTADTDWLR